MGEKGPANPDFSRYCHFKTFRKLLFEKPINFEMGINKTITIFQSDETFSGLSHARKTTFGQYPWTKNL